jgi:hypothetical protein
MNGHCRSGNERDTWAWLHLLPNKALDSTVRAASLRSAARPAVTDQPSRDAAAVELCLGGAVVNRARP